MLDSAILIEGCSMWHAWILGVLLCALLLVDHLVSSFLKPTAVQTTMTSSTINLVPSQVIADSKYTQYREKCTKEVNPWLIPSQVIHARVPVSLYASPSLTTEATTTDKDEHATSQPQQQPPSLPQSRRSRRRKRPMKKKRPVKTNLHEDQDHYPTTGNLPDPWFRSISLPHLRLHPRFRPLPTRVPKLQTLEDVARFRQESWQWDALHRGRCTTSQAAGALGFLNPSAGQQLGVPTSWQRGGMGSYHRLRQDALRTVEDMNQAFYEPGMDHAVVGDEEEDELEDDGGDSFPLWQQPSNNTHFDAEYLYETGLPEYQRRKKAIRERAGGEYLDRGIRMMWGNAQEATSVLTALNYFAKLDPNVVIAESGMCGAGLDCNTTSASSHGGLLVGATPDGVIQYSDGRVEALEVKNHCPFFSNRGRKRHQGRIKRFSIGDRLTHDGGVLPQYVSQLQLEMLCLGPHCTSAVMVRQTATQGAIILRMKRDEKWINEMMHFLNRFQTEFVVKESPPSYNFFWDNPDDLDEQARYRRFVNQTAQLRNSVEHVATIPNDEIQRVEGSAPFFLDGF